MIAKIVVSLALVSCAFAAPKANGVAQGTPTGHVHQQPGNIAFTGPAIAYSAGPVAYQFIPQPGPVIAQSAPVPAHQPPTVFAHPGSIVSFNPQAVQYSYPAQTPVNAVQLQGAPARPAPQVQQAPQAPAQANLPVATPHAAQQLVQQVNPQYQNTVQLQQAEATNRNHLNHVAQAVPYTVQALPNGVAAYQPVQTIAHAQAVPVANYAPAVASPGAVVQYANQEVAQAKPYSTVAYAAAPEVYHAPTYTAVINPAHLIYSSSPVDQEREAARNAQARQQN